MTYVGNEVTKYETMYQSAGCTLQSRCGVEVGTMTDRVFWPIDKMRDGGTHNTSAEMRAMKHREIKLTAYLPASTR